MLLFVTLALFFYSMGANSTPCRSGPESSGSLCEAAINSIIHNLNRSPIGIWKTHAVNETEVNFINCNLKTFKNDFDRQWKGGNCTEYKNQNLPQCLIYKGLECLPYDCKKVPDTVCSTRPSLVKRNFKKVLKNFLGTIRRIKI